MARTSLKSRPFDETTNHSESNTRNGEGGEEMLQIEFKSVSKGFVRKGQRTDVLRNVNLVCESGKFTTLVGPSGCGKTTMLNLAAGLVQPDEGNIMVGDRQVRGPGPDRGVVFQQYALFPWLTVSENIEFGLRCKGTPRGVRAAIIQHYLELVGLAKVANALPKELSGGMKQRCALARALAVGPEVLLLDEPFGALDAITRERLQQELLRISQTEGCTVLFVTHDVDEAVFLSDRVVTFDSVINGIRATTNIPLTYPRMADIRLSEEFLELKRSIWSFMNSALKESDGAGTRLSSKKSPRNVS